jgi:hypothetical protein
MLFLGLRSLIAAAAAAGAAIRPLHLQQALPPSKFAPKTVCVRIDTFLSDQVASEDATEWHRMGLIWNVKVPEHAFRAVARTEDAKVDLRTADTTDYTDAIAWHKMGFVSSVQIPKAAFAPVTTTARPKRVDFAPPDLGEAVGSLLGKQKTSLERRETRLAQSALRETRSAIFLGAEKKRWREK